MRMRTTLWIFFSILLILAGILAKQELLLFIAVLILLITGTAKFWSLFCLERVEFRRILSHKHVFFGDEIIYEAEITNRKPLPLPWIQIEDELPKQIELLKGKPVQISEDRVALVNKFSVKWYHRVKRRYSVHCANRGYFTFGPARLRSGDLFGFFSREITVKNIDYIYVFPRLVQLDDLGISSKQLAGEILLKNNLFHDPVLVSGLREFAPGDSLRTIHWKSTARHGRLLTKIFEPAASVEVCIFVDVRTIRPPYWGNILQLLELVIITAASVARFSLDSGYQAGMYINQTFFSSSETNKIQPGRHPEQLLRILKILSQVHGTESLSMHQFLQNESYKLPLGASLIMITACLSNELTSMLDELKRRGRQIILIKVGGEPPDLENSHLNAYHVNDNTAWNIIEKLNIKPV